MLIHRHVPAALFLLLLLVLSAPAVATADEIALGSAPLPAGARLGVDTVGRLPRTLQTAAVGGLTFLFADLDGDGRVTPGGKDGIGLSGLPFIVTLPAALLMPDGQFDIAISGTTLSRTAQQLPVDAALIAKAAYLTEIRIAGGLVPVLIDGKMSQDGVLHCDYLEQNKDAQGMDLHNEYPDRPGYTDAGKAAGAGSDLFPGISDFRSAVDGWYRSVWHGAPMLRPGLRIVGVAHKHNMAVLYFGTGGSGNEPVMHPPDGAVNMPTAFGERGEVPNPVAGSNNGIGCGFPIIVHLPGNLRRTKLVAATLTDASGNKVAGTFSCPAQPANPSWPGNSGVAAFVPAAPLAKGTFTARFEMEGQAPWVWTFSTDATLAAGSGTPGTPDAPPARLASDTEVKRKLRDRPAPLQLADQSLADAFAQLAATHGLPIQLEEAAAARLAADGKVTASLRALTLGDLLDDMCKLKHLVATVRDGAVWISAEPVAEAPAVPQFESGTPEFDLYMELAKSVVPRGHHALKAASVSESIAALNEQYRDKVGKMVEYRLRTARGDDRKRLNAIRELLGG
ncbi:MAG: hypothetical protein AB7K09_03455 [Planctomycetota bacterium]